MQRRLAYRYKCDFCGKTSGSGGHMKVHEKKCTMNPNRICNMCRIIDQPQPDLQELIGLLPNPKEYLETDEYDTEVYTNLGKVIAEILPKLREKAGDCPVCIFSALRQKGIPICLVQEFDFRKEIQSCFDKAHEEEDYNY